MKRATIEETKSMLYFCRKHAFVDLASEMDLTKGLTLDGEMFLDKPMRIAKAKVKSEDQIKVKKKKNKRGKKDFNSLFPVFFLLAALISKKKKKVMM